MKNLFLRLANNRFALFNVLIASVYTLAAVFLIIGILANNAPSELITTTGTVSRFKNHEADWFSKTFANDYSYFNVSFTNGSFFEIIGGYDNIDSTLFSELSIGDTLTVTYQKRGSGANNRIYGLQYNSKTYLDKNSISPPHDQYKRMITYIIILAVATGVAIVLVIINYFVNKKKHKTPDNASHGL